MSQLLGGSEEPRKKGSLSLLVPITKQTTDEGRGLGDSCRTSLHRCAAQHLTSTTHKTAAEPSWLLCQRMSWRPFGQLWIVALRCKLPALRDTNIPHWRKLDWKILGSLKGKLVPVSVSKYTDLIKYCLFPPSVGIGNSSSLALLLVMTRQKETSDNWGEAIQHIEQCACFPTQHVLLGNDATQSIIFFFKRRGSRWHWLAIAFE